MDKDKIVKTIFIILFIIFITIYISQATGYYEYELHKKSELTNEQIKQFELAVKEGKRIDMEDYLGNTTKNYSNKFSVLGTKFSKTTSKYIKKGIEGTFKFLEKLLS